MPTGDRQMIMDTSKLEIDTQRIERLEQEKARLLAAILRHKEFVNAVNPHPCKGDMELHAALTHTFHMPNSEVLENCGRITDADVIRHEESEFHIAKKIPETLVVNLFAGPYAGKRRMAAGIFFELKPLGISADIVLEDEDRHQMLGDQIYMFGKQYHRIYCLLGRVKVIITNGPLLLTPIYDVEHRPTLEKLVVEEHKKMWTYNVFINRKKPYNSKGHNQTEDDSMRIDMSILNLLDKHNVCYEVFGDTHAGRDAIVKKILLLLQWRAH